MRYRILLLVWLVTDILIFVGGYAAAYFLRVGLLFSSNFPFDQHMTAAAIAAPLWLLVLATTRTFHLTRNQKTLRNGAYIAYAALVGVAMFTLIYYFTFNEFFSRLLLVNALVITSAGIWIWHILFEYTERIVLRMNPPVFPTLIVGVTRESKELIHALNRRRNPLKPVAILDGHGVKEHEIDKVPVLGKLNKLEETLARFNITKEDASLGMPTTFNGIIFPVMYFAQNYFYFTSYAFPIAALVSSALMLSSFRVGK